MMENMLFRRILAGVLGILLLLGWAVLPVGAVTLTELRKAQEEVESKIEQYKQTISSANNKISSVSNEMSTLDQKISEREQEISSLENAIQDKESVIRNLEEDLVMAQLSYTERQKAFHDRLRTIYQNGQASFLEVLVDATDMTDFLVRFELMSRLTACDEQMLEEIEGQRLELENMKNSLMEDQNELLETKHELESTRQQLTAAKNDKENLQQQLLTEKQLAQKALEEEEKSNQEIEKMIKEYIARQAQTGSYEGGQFAWPTPGYTRITSEYGWRIHPITKSKSMHTGIDIAAPRNGKIIAPADGKVIYAGWYGAYGNCTIIDHGGGLTSMYGHQNRLGVSEGQVVLRGEQIGYVGTTGLSTGNHLHFEVRLQGNHTSPWPYLNGD